MLWGTVPQLEVLLLFNKPLTGMLPAAWGGLTRLRELDLSSCTLDGELQVTWFGMSAARSITSSGNVLTGRFPAQWGFISDDKSDNLRSVNLSKIGNNPCMSRVVLQDSISKSKIEASGRVTVDISGVGLGGSVCE